MGAGQWFSRSLVTNGKWFRKMELIPSKDQNFILPRSLINNITLPNTDGSVNKLVTVFAGDVYASPSKIASWVWARMIFFFQPISTFQAGLASKFCLHQCTRTRASAGYKFLYRELFLPSSLFVPRDCTNVFEHIHLDRFKLCSPEICTAITPAPNKNCTMTAKTAPCFAPCRLRKIVTKTCNPADALRSAQQRLLTLTAGPLAIMGILQTRQIIIRKIVYLW